MTRCQIKYLLLIFQERVHDSVAEVEDMEGGASSNTIDIALPIASLVYSTDCKAETINTIFSLLKDDAVFGALLLSVEGSLFDQAVINLKLCSISKLDASRLLPSMINCKISIIF